MTAANGGEILMAATAEGRASLLEHEAYALLAGFGIPTPPHLFVPLGGRVAESDLAAIRGGEAVVKIVSPDIAHKSDVGGLRFARRDAAEVARAIDEMTADVRRRAPAADLRGALVVERVAFDANLPGTEYLASVRVDPAFGPVILFALGGLLAEWYGRLAATTTRVFLPVDGFDRERAIATITASPLGEIALAPSRIHARAPIDARALGGALEGLAQLAAATMAAPERDAWGGGAVGGGRRVSSSGARDAAWPRLAEIEINPLAAAGGRLVALDAIARLARAPEASARPPRAPRPIAAIAPLLHPRSAAVCGASNKSVNAGRIILRNLRTANGIDYGHLYAIHPSAPSIDGVRCYPDAASLPECVDLAVVSVPAASARASIGDLIGMRRARAIILIPGGFAETGRGDLAHGIADDLAAARARAADAASREGGGASGGSASGSGAAGPVLLGGNCLGIVSKGEYNTFFLPHYKLPFHDAPGDNLVVVSQSGAYLVTLTSNLDGIIFPRASVSYGNEMDLTAADFLEYYLDHEADARIFGFYVEGFPEGEGRRFLRLVRRATAEGRAVVVYKAGKTAAGAEAAASHTASMAGDYEVARALLAGAGAIATETLNMFEDYTKSITMLAGRAVGGRRVGVITNAGFEAGAVSDHLYALELARLSRETESRVAAALPEIAHAQNPVDATPMANTSAFIAAVEAVAADPNVDMLIVSAIPAAATLDVLAPDLTGAHEENIFAMGSLPAELVRVNRAITKPMVVTIDSGRLYDPSVMVLERAGIPVFRKIDRASRALSAVASFHLDTRGRAAAR